MSAWQSLVAGFDISRFGRATPRFDPAELKLLNGRILGMMDYAEVSDRLADMGVDMGGGFWDAIRGNLSTLAEASDLHAIITAPITPVIDADDSQMLAVAAKLLPDGEPDTEHGPAGPRPLLLKPDVRARGCSCRCGWRLPASGQARNSPICCR